MLVSFCNGHELLLYLVASKEAFIKIDGKPTLGELY